MITINVTAINQNGDAVNSRVHATSEEGCCFPEEILTAAFSKAVTKILEWADDDMQG